MNVWMNRHEDFNARAAGPMEPADPAASTSQLFSWTLPGLHGFSWFTSAQEVKTGAWALIQTVSYINLGEGRPEGTWGSFDHSGKNLTLDNLLSRYLNQNTGFPYRHLLIVVGPSITTNEIKIKPSQLKEEKKLKE